MATALNLADRGYHVIPLHNVGSSGVCSCSKHGGCQSAGKHPRTRNGEHDATCSQKMIRDWWKKWPAANIGIATGPSGLVVLDLDVPRGSTSADGLRTWNDLCRDRVLSVNTVMVQTGSGGRHLYFRRPAGVYIHQDSLKESRMGAGIHIKASTGMVVAVGSSTNKGTYSWVKGHDPDTVAIADLPPELLRELTKPRTAAQPRASAPGVISDGERNVRLASEAGTLAHQFVKRLDAINQEKCEEPLEYAEVEGIATKILDREFSKLRGAKLPNELIRAELTWQAKVVFALRSSHLQQGKGAPSKETVRKELGIGTNQLQRFCRELQAAGWWDRAEETPKRSYFILPHELLCDPEVRPLSKALAMILGQCGDSYGKSIISQGRICEHLGGISRQQVNHTKGLGPYVEVHVAPYDPKKQSKAACSTYWLRNLN
ncbi:MAG TPA: bifunctional DNA primase/polymerase [Armatimonadota bacterium]